MDAIRPKWLVAKYMPDLRRREPVNLGVLLFTDGQLLARFFGENARGDIDGRRLGGKVSSLANYRAWVDYWRDLGTSSASPAPLLDDVSRDANFYLEPGGEVLSQTVADPRVLLYDLFRILVDKPQDDERDAETIDTAATEIFSRLGISDRVAAAEVEFELAEGVKDLISFDYRFDNGRPHLMQRVPLTANRRDRATVHQYAWTFRVAQEARSVLGRPGRIALVKLDGFPAMTIELERAVGILRTCAEVIDVGEIDVATEEMGRHLSVV